MRVDRTIARARQAAYRTSKVGLLIDRLDVPHAHVDVGLNRRMHDMDLACVGPYHSDEVLSAEAAHPRGFGMALQDLPTFLDVAFNCTLSIYFVRERNMSCCGNQYSSISRWWSTVRGRWRGSGRWVAGELNGVNRS